MYIGRIPDVRNSKDAHKQGRTGDSTTNYDSTSSLFYHSHSRVRSVYTISSFSIFECFLYLKKGLKMDSKIALLAFVVTIAVFLPTGDFFNFYFKFSGEEVKRHFKTDYLQ